MAGQERDASSVGQERCLTEGFSSLLTNDALPANGEDAESEGGVFDIDIRDIGSQFMPQMEVCSACVDAKIFCTHGALLECVAQEQLTGNRRASSPTLALQPSEPVSSVDKSRHDNAITGDEPRPVPGQHLKIETAAPQKSFSVLDWGVSDGAVPIPRVRVGNGSADMWSQTALPPWEAEWAMLVEYLTAVDEAPVCELCWHSIKDGCFCQVGSGN